MPVLVLLRSYQQLPKRIINVTNRAALDPEYSDLAESKVRESDSKLFLFIIINDNEFWTPDIMQQRLYMLPVTWSNW